MQKESIQLDFFDFLTVHQPCFEGPLDILINLIRRKKMDIQEISLSDICEPYLKYVSQMREINMEVAVEFLHLASTLILIKSRSLLPATNLDDDENLLDTEDQLKQKLIAYQKVKQWAELFRQRDLLGRDVFCRPEAPAETDEKVADPVFTDLTLYKLLQSYQKLGQKKSFLKAHQVTKEEISIEERIVEIGELMISGRELLFHEMIKEPHNKAEWVLSFMAVLELTKMLLTTLYQAQEFGQIYIRHLDNLPGTFQPIKDLLKKRDET